MPELRDFAARYTAAWCSNNPARVAAFYSDEGSLRVNDDRPATDTKSIRESWAALLGPNTTVSWNVSKAEVAESGELGYLYGTYSLSIRDPQGLPVHDTGKLVEIWKKQADEKWKCIVDTYNSDLPVTAAPETKK